MSAAPAQINRPFGSPGQRAFNAGARAVLGTLFRVATRLHVSHLAPVPRTGALILAANHISHFDPPLIGSVFPRHVDWMAMEELFRNPHFGRALALTGAFPVDRSGADRTALRTAQRRLLAGRCVGIFPEGGIRDGERSILNAAPMRPGVAMLALLAGAPILPTLVLGTDRLYHKGNWRPARRPPAWVVTGAPISPSGTREELTARLTAELIALKEETVRRFALRAEDLPHSPQARMAEPPYVHDR